MWLTEPATGLVQMVSFQVIGPLFPSPPLPQYSVLPIDYRAPSYSQPVSCLHVAYSGGLHSGASSVYSSYTASPLALSFVGLPILLTAGPAVLYGDPSIMLSGIVLFI